MQYEIEQKKIEFKGREYSVDDFCFKPISDQGCLITSPLDYWKKDLKRIREDKDLQVTMLCFADELNKMPCSDKNGIPVIQNVVLGGIQCQYNIKGALGKQCVASANALMVTYLLNNDLFTSDAAMQWEKEVYLQTINKYQSIFNQNGLKLSYMAERSIPDELNDETQQNLFVVVISYVVMFIYITVAIGSIPSKIHTGFLLGLFGILIVIISLVCSIGLAGYLNVGLSMISAEVVPFLVLAIGVDNMFIISNAYKRTDASNTIENRMAYTLSEVGPSITTAAICEFSAFIVGYFTNIPALSQFSFIAAFAVIFDFIFQIFGFVAFMAWDEARKLKNKADFLFCITVAPEQEKESKTIKLVENYLIPLVFHPISKLLIFIIFLALISVSILGCFKLDYGLEQQVSLIENSYLYNYFDSQFKYGQAGPPAYVVLENVDYQDKNQLTQIKIMQDTLSALDKSVQPPIYDWTQVFNQFLNTNGNWKEACDSENAILLPFNLQLQKFISIKISSDCCQDYGICGEQFEKDIIFNENGEVISSRLRFQHVPLQTSKQFIQAFHQARKVVDHFRDTINKDISEESKKVKMYAYSLFYIYFEQYSYVGGLAITNLLVATAIVYLIMMLVKNARSALFTYIIVFCISFDIIGLCYLTNLIFSGFQIQINAVSVVNLIIAVGLSVEFCVHIIISFMNAIGTREERAKKSLQIMGSSIFIGIILTKLLGVIILAFANSTLFRLYYFRMYFFIIILGTFHGLFFLPIVLSYIGPKSSRATEGQNSYETDKLLERYKIKNSTNLN